jgi:hypothetical protein
MPAGPQSAERGRRRATALRKNIDLSKLCRPMSTSAANYSNENFGTFPLF